MAHLTFVPTPVGNLEDITLRALKVLKAADIVAAEDTRHSGKLLSHYGISTMLVRLDSYTIEARAPKILSNHQNIAYISDAGTPGISDPGVKLVQIALKRGDKVEVLPGATAFIPALVLSGLPLAQFYFAGFLPRKGKERRKKLQSLAVSEYTSCFYESPKRLISTLQELTELCEEDRQISVSREISKKFETTYRGTLKSIFNQLKTQEVKGEIVIVIAPYNKPQSNLSFASMAEGLAAKGCSGRDLQLALINLGAPRNVAYKLSLELSKSTQKQ